jgi:hypothetical protein
MLYFPTKNLKVTNMNEAALGPVWIHPPRFWKVIEGKSEEEIAELLDYITQLLAEGQIEALLRFDFVTGIGYPYPNSSRGMGGRKKLAA